MRSKIFRLAAALLFLLGLVVGALTDAQPERWAEKLYNPKPAADDLVLPMPCGGAMVFRKIEVPTAGWVEDKPIMLGEEDENLAYAEGLRQGYLGGSFTDPQAPARRYFWLGKYEVSQLQWAAVQSDCPTPKMRGRLPQTGVNWYTAVAFAERYSEWLYQHALDQLPQEAGVPGFLRLPTEAEWEYAARGGSMVNAAEFQARTFPTPDGLNRYAWYAGAGSALGKRQLTGLLQPNPLRLYDILGNAEEIVLEPFRLSTRNRLHGQAGGFITKGGHYLTAQADLRSAYRREYAHFDAAKQAPTQVETIGFRLVLSGTVIPTHERLAALKAQWQKQPATGQPEVTPPALAALQQQYAELKHLLSEQLASLRQENKQLNQVLIEQLALLQQGNAELKEALAAAYQKATPQGGVAGAEKPVAPVPAIDAELVKLTDAAERGEVFSQYKLGQRYASGQGVAQDDAKAADWYRQAAEGGHIEAQRELGLRYAQGRGVSQNDAEAVTWLRKAAESGDATAQYELGMRYEQGEGVAQDDREAIKWYRMAAAQGHAEAAESLKRVVARLQAKEPEGSPLLGGMEFVPIKGGCFQMGSPPTEAGRDEDERQHRVCVDGFALAATEVTNAQYRLFKPSHDSGTYSGKSLNGDNQPVVNVSWEDAVAYARWLSKRTGQRYRLPTEAEWEYAARAGTTTARYWGDEPNQACRYANVHDRSLTQVLSFILDTHNCDDGYAVSASVAQFRPNGFGLYDILGNVREWTCSEYDESYSGAERECKSNKRAGDQRVIRGGSWNYGPRSVRSADRYWDTSGVRDDALGFRLARDLLPSDVIRAKKSMSEVSTTDEDLAAKEQERAHALGGMEFVPIKGGCFQMGSPPYEAGRDEDEQRHRVCVDDFALAATEVTNAQYRLFKPSHDSGTYSGRSLNGDNQPVVNVSWEDAVAYAAWLSQRTGRRYRLPTEAEWEYTARAGTTTARYWGDEPNQVCRYANVSNYSEGCNDGHAVSAPVGRFQPNRFGLYDMLGNVWEWTCSEYYESYGGAEQECQSNKHAGGRRVVRGGSWFNKLQRVHSAARNWNLPDSQNFNIGFRLAQDLQPSDVSRAENNISEAPTTNEDLAAKEQKRSPSSGEMAFVHIKGGCFEMGSPPSEKGRNEDEQQHHVCVDDFALATTEVTNAQYRLFKPSHDSGIYSGESLNGDNQPVVNVSWEDAVAYAEWLSKRTGRRYRLPTEAEWEYAARAGTTTARYWGDEPNQACRYANVGNYSQGCDDGYMVSAPVGQFQPNGLGLHDTLGNVWEWTCSEYDKGYGGMERECQNNKHAGGLRVRRGSSWGTDPRWVRAAARRKFSPVDRDIYVGFRLAQDLHPDLVAEVHRDVASVSLTDQELSGLTEAAQAGDVFAQYKLGQRYASGQGVAQDDAKAADWYRKAAEGGHIEAQRELGLLYWQGRGVSQDDAEAITWLRKAAERGDATAQHELGVRYEQGQGVAQDDREAIKWYRMAATQGYAEAGESLKRVEARLKAKELVLAGMEFVPIKGGCFQMGSPPSEAGRNEDEQQHRACVDDFALATTEVTNAQYRLFKPSHDSGTDRGESLNGDNQPVVNVDWGDAVAYAEWLSQRTGQRYRLPTEAEWEYAARAGTTTARYWGNDPDRACQFANVGDRTFKRAFRWGAHDCDDSYAVTAPVGIFQPNVFGLYDTLGNVWEWTCSEYDSRYGGAEQRCIRPMVRGGSWSSDPRYVRSAIRYAFMPVTRNDTLGFRLAQDLQPSDVSRAETNILEVPPTNEDLAAKEPEHASALGGMAFVPIKGGCFEMGSPPSEKGRDEDERQHQVCVDDFALATTEVTNAQYRLFKPSHDSGTYSGKSLNGDNQPVVNVSWEDAVAYARWLSKRTGQRYRLPTEAEWEYAARAGTTTARYWGDEPNQACRYANVHDRSLTQVLSFILDTHNCDDGYAVSASVAQFGPNGSGLYDILGNVREWTCSEYDESYSGAERECKSNKRAGDQRVIRGGSWNYGPRSVRSADRYWDTSGVRDDALGFRLARDLLPSDVIRAKKNMSEVPTANEDLAAKEPERARELGGMAFVPIKGGCFEMGSPPSEKGRRGDEEQHRVCVDDFALATTEVTNAQYRLFKPSHDSGIYGGKSLNSDNQPVVNVSWKDAVAYAEWLSKRTGQRYRLPTETEWEYAARAGTTTARYWGDGPDQACQFANVDDRASKRAFGIRWGAHDCDDGYAVTAPVGIFQRNMFGLYDMLGNVWEWTCSEYDSNYRGQEKHCVSQEHAGVMHVLRGGSWYDVSEELRSAARYTNDSGSRSSYKGFRLARDLSPSDASRVENNIPEAPTANDNPAEKEQERTRALGGMEFVPVKGGCFQMGSPPSEAGRSEDEKQHRVCVDDFTLATTEVSNAQYRLFKPSHDSGTYNGESLNGDKQPVVEVSWEDAVAYAEWLSQRTGQRYRLPTEAEWEYAARAGTTTARYWGDDPDQACAFANVYDRTSTWVLAFFSGRHDCDDAYKVSAPAGQFQPNKLGLYDMLGNVWEWTCSEYDEDYGGAERACQSSNRVTGRRVIHGGSWDDKPQGVRSAVRGWDTPGYQLNNLGFRLAQDF